MSKHGRKTKEIQIDGSLIESASEYLAHLPKSAHEVIENLTLFASLLPQLRDTLKSKYAFNNSICHPE